ncbi:MAG: hypothetical protein ACRCT1_01725 [Microcoleaceae cyanobacterium]
MWLDKLGDWNPQLFREIKGRLNKRNLAIASLISLLSQLLIWIKVRTDLPIAPALGEYKNTIDSRYCTGNLSYYGSYACQRGPVGDFIINWQNWYLDVFFWLSFCGIFALLIGGTYLLINDIEKEESRGTLNFIRLSPQSSAKILIGKLLGVPIVLYLAGLIALPLHLWLGLTLHLSLLQLLSYYLVLIAGCCLIYNLALILSFVGSWLGGFKPWLGSGIVATFFMLAWTGSVSTPFDVINVVSPTFIFKHLILAVNHQLYGHWDGFNNLQKLSFFEFPIKNWGLATPLSLLIDILVIWWTFQGLKRRFSNPGSTIFSKRQSYLIVGTMELLFLGFSRHNSSEVDYVQLFLLNLLLFLALILALTPDRQSLYDWTRYRHQMVSHRQGLSFRSLMLDLIWNEKSPPLIALAINLVIAGLVLTPWLLYKNYFLSWIFTINLILIYACLSQLILLMKSSKRAIWATCVLGGLIVGPCIILGMLSLSPDKTPGLWLSLAFPIFWGWEAVEKASQMVISLSMLFHWSVLGLLSFYLIRRLKIAGESASQALLKSANPS